MARQSARFTQFRKRIDELMVLLPPSDPTGTYTPAQVDSVRSFLLLAHAEIEAYIEDAACDALKRAVGLWITDGKARVSLAHLLLHMDFRNLSPAWHQGSTAERVEKAYDRFETYARLRNHGVKEHNVLALLLPVGLGSAIDPVWLGTIDSFGTSRGEVAHTSRSVQSPPDRDSQLAAVNIIVAGLEALDRRLLAIPSKRMAAQIFSWANAVAGEVAAVQSG